MKNYDPDLKMNSYFASPERADDKTLSCEIDFISNNPVMSGLLHSISGLLAVLNEHRQIIAFNESFLKMIGIDDPAGVLGLRPGEALECIHAHKEPAGCGTTKFCASCGAAVAMVSSLGQDRPVEKTCALTARRNQKDVDMVLMVKSHPLCIDGKKLLLLFLQDITRQQQRAALERTFFHDVNNLLQMLVGAGELAVYECRTTSTQNVLKIAMRLHKEIVIQQCLFQDDSGAYQTVWESCTPGQVLEELQSLFRSHPAAKGKYIDFSHHVPVLSFRSDVSLLLRVVSNMVVNALEASDENGRVEIRCDHIDDTVCFSVWNDREISPKIINRIFQRNFSTKNQAGRGIGTYSMKLFGENILGGQVTFTTSGEQGTVFKITLPV